MPVPNAAQNFSGNNPWGEGGGKGTKSSHIAPRIQDLSEVWSTVHNVTGRGIDVRYSGKGVSSKITISIPESIDSPGPFAPSIKRGESGVGDSIVIGGCPEAFETDHPTGDLKPGRSETRPGILILDGNIRLFTEPEIVSLSTPAPPLDWSNPSSWPINWMELLEEYYDSLSKPTFNNPDPTGILGLSASEDLNKLLVLAADPGNLDGVFYTFLSVDQIELLTDWKLGAHYIFPLAFITVKQDTDDSDLVVESIAWKNEGWILQGGGETSLHPWKVTLKREADDIKLNVEGGHVYWGPGEEVSVLYPSPILGGYSSGYVSQIKNLSVKSYLQAASSTTSSWESMKAISAAGPKLIVYIKAAFVRPGLLPAKYISIEITDTYTDLHKVSKYYPATYDLEGVVTSPGDPYIEYTIPIAEIWTNSSIADESTSFYVIQLLSDNVYLPSGVTAIMKNVIGISEDSTGTTAGTTSLVFADMHFVNGNLVNMSNIVKVPLLNYIIDSSAP